MRARVPNYCPPSPFHTVSPRHPVNSAGQSGVSLEHPGMDRVRDLLAASGLLMVLGKGRDRVAREPAYHHLLNREFVEPRCKLRRSTIRETRAPRVSLPTVSSTSPPNLSELR
jgi:hypothetical protein